MKKLRRMATLAIVAAALALAGWWTLLYLSQDAMLYPRHVIAPPGSARPPDAAITLRHRIPQGTVEAWLLPAPSASPDAPAPLTVFFHGNAELIDHQQDTVARYHAMGVSVLLPEFRGYGRSDGSPSQVGIRQDALHFIAQVVRRPEVDADRLIFHGRSLGGAVAADLALHRKPAALLLQSTFASVPAMARRFLAPPLLIRNPYRTDRVLPALGIPVRLHHGRRDEVIPFDHALTLAATLPAPHGRVVEFDSGHNDFPGSLEADDRYWHGIRDFLVQSDILRPTAITP